jgi:drug/metabolite transporter (DMT)-like permease
MALIWGVNYSVVKHGLRTLPPLTFNGVRVALAAVVLGVVAATVRDKAWPSRRDVLALAGLGLLGNGLYQLLFIAGMARTRAGIAALVVAAGPAYIAIISRLLGRERLSLRGWAGIGLQLAGVGFVVASTQGLEASREALVGAALIAAGSVTWALFSVLLQPYTTRAHPLHLSAITMASGALLLVTIAAPGLAAHDWGAVSPGEWGTIAYAGIGALVVAYLLFYRGVRVLGPTRTSMYGNLQPLIALLVAWAFLAEHPSAWQWTGAAFVMGGLLLSRTARLRPAPAAPPARVARR